ncbi:sulfatase family protein [Mariniblastus fucicola]|uniref:Arylsulfatase n=1 Tax=Mariniblastus fucicola TaxID=980251 RepID=A0A5B9PHV0_9BACT|nr:arylsulfatase [Mariniblastus fucicola]QEG24252.1 Arylsulfatase [Mariniblastus fucicola]
MNRLIAVLLVLAFLGNVTFADELSQKPNIVLVLADDLGLGDVSFHTRHVQKKEPLFETPTLDDLAAKSLWFTDGHSATALCAPTRYAVMSGNNNYRSYQPWGVWSTFAKTAFVKGHATLGTVVRDAGYRTGFVGKWHLGGDFNVPGSDQVFRGKKNGDLRGKVDMTKMIGGGPKFCGFDYDFTTPCGIQGPHYLVYENQVWAPINNVSKIIFMNKDTAKNPGDLASKGEGMGDSQWDTRQLGKILSAKAVDFIEESAAQEEPFFLYYCSPMVHRPHVPPKEFDGKPIKGQTPSSHLDMVLDFDMQMKRIVDALKATGEFENTLFVLTSDNGGLQDGPARKVGYQVGGGFNGSKNSPLEGGHRIPCFAMWPGKIEPGICDELVVNQDMIATFAALVGTEIPEGQAQDSNNLLPLLTGDGKFRPRSSWINQAGSKNEVMIRKMPWKLIIQSNNKRSRFEPIALYNLQSDPGEKQNQLKVDAHQNVVATLLAEYLETVNSGQPTAPSRMND